MTQADAYTVYRVFARIRCIADRHRNVEDCYAMYRLLGGLEFHVFGIPRTNLDPESRA